MEQIEVRIVKDNETLFLWERGMGDYYSKEPDPQLHHTFTGWMYRLEGDTEDRLAAWEDHAAGTSEVFCSTNLSLIEAIMDTVIAAAEAEQTTED